MIHYRKMTKNYIFRKFECGLSKDETAKLCFKTVRIITGWDNGREIPPECKRLMRFYKGREISHHNSWLMFRMVGDRLELPTGKQITSQQLLTAVALLEIQSPLDLETTGKLARYVRAIARIKD